jgi:uncharacterized protein YprB with RNaseH-like and TPR domain
MLGLVAFDTETTGFGGDDNVTTLGVAVPVSVRVVVQRAGCRWCRESCQFEAGE